MDRDLRASPREPTRKTSSGRLLAAGDAENPPGSLLSSWPPLFPTPEYRWLAHLWVCARLVPSGAEFRGNLRLPACAIIALPDNCRVIVAVAGPASYSPTRRTLRRMAK